MTDLSGSPPAPARRWARFSVRGLLLAVLLIGVGLRWHDGRSKAQREAVAAIEAAGGRVTYDLDGDDDGGAPAGAWAKRLVGIFGIDRVATAVEVYTGPRFDDAAMAATSRLSSLEVLRIVECPVTDAGVAAGLGGLRRLKSLHLYGDEGGPKLTRAIIPAVAGLAELEELGLGVATVRLEDADLERLSGLARLRGVTLGGPGVTDLGLAALARLPALEDLHLVGTSVTEAGLAHLARCKALRHIDLEGFEATTLEPLRDLPNLTHLLASNAPLVSLWDSPVTGLGSLETLILRRMPLADAGLAHLGGLTGLKLLVLDETKLTDAGLAHVGRCVGLDDLDLSGAAITTLGPLRNLKRLEELDVSGTAIDTLDPIRGMPRLKKLDARGCPIAVAWATPPAGLDSLEYLYLDKTRVAGAGMAGLANLASVITLSLSGSTVDDAGLAHVASMKGLADLDLGSTPITDSGLAHLGAMKGLADLDLSSTAITDAGLARLSGMAALADLDLSGTAVGDAGVPHLLALPGTPEITLVRTRLTDAGLRRLAAPGGFRGELVVGGPTLTEGAVRAAEDANPDLKIFRRFGDEPREAGGGDAGP